MAIHKTKHKKLTLMDCHACNNKQHTAKLAVLATTPRFALNFTLLYKFAFHASGEKIFKFKLFLSYI